MWFFPKNCGKTLYSELKQPTQYCLGCQGTCLSPPLRKTARQCRDLSWDMMAVVNLLCGNGSEARVIFQGELGTVSPPHLYPTAARVTMLVSGEQRGRFTLACHRKRIWSLRESLRLETLKITTWWVWPRPLLSAWTSQQFYLASSPHFLISTHPDLINLFL